MILRGMGSYEERGIEINEIAIRGQRYHQLMGDILEYTKILIDIAVDDMTTYMLINKYDENFFYNKFTLKFVDILSETSSHIFKNKLVDQELRCIADLYINIFNKAMIKIFKLDLAYFSYYIDSRSLSFNVLNYQDFCEVRGHWNEIINFRYRNKFL